MLAVGSGNQAALQARKEYEPKSGVPSDIVIACDNSECIH